MFANLPGLTVADPLDLAPGPLVFPIADQGAEPGEVKDEPKEDVFNQVHDAGPQDILKADVEVLSIDALEKGGDGEDGAVQGEEQIEPEDKLPDEQMLFKAFPWADIILLEGLKNSSYPKCICRFPKEELPSAEELADRIEEEMKQR